MGWIHGECLRAAKRVRAFQKSLDRGARYLARVSCWLQDVIVFVLLVILKQLLRAGPCKFWESGKCIFQSNCVNAHGEKEIGTKRPAFMTPLMKKRRADESVEDFRASVLSKPSGRDYSAKVLPPKQDLQGQ